MGKLQLGVVRTPDRPGPGPIPDELLRTTELKIQRKVQSLLSGDYRSPWLGVGTELAQIRLYQPGDDVRHIDWNVTARTRQPHVRVHLAERSVVVWLVLDCSPSMAFGTADRRKADVAEGVALVVGHIAGRRSNRLGVLTFGERQSRLLPPRQGRMGLLGLLSTLHRQPEPDGVGSGSLAQALGQMGRILRQRAVVVLVSDFLGGGDWREPLLRIAGRHEVIAVDVRDPRETELPNVGQLWLVDPETGQHLQVDTSSRPLRQRFARAAAADQRDRAELFSQLGVRHVPLSTESDWLRTFVTFIRTQRRSQ
ncbi:MAG: DUF58 domain-containing protein [Chloroflexota bacterium]|nr:DUF58 domain-containing protein [Chloroflexota bacterium]